MTSFEALQATQQPAQPLVTVLTNRHKRTSHHQHNLGLACTVARMSDVALLKIFRSLTTMLTRAGVSAGEVIPQRDEGVWWLGGDDECSGDEDGVFITTAFITVTFITIHLHHIRALAYFYCRHARSC